MKRPSDPRKTRPTSGAGGSGPKTRRSPASSSSTSKRGPARGEGAAPGRARTSTGSAEGPTPRKTTGATTRTRGSSPPVNPRKSSGRKPAAGSARPNPGTTARRTRVDEAGPEDSRASGRSAAPDAGRGRGRADGGKSGPRGLKIVKPGPGARVGSRGRVERPAPHVRGDDPSKQVRGAGGDKPPRRGSAVERLLAGGQPGERPPRPPAIRDEFADKPAARRSPAPTRGRGGDDPAKRGPAKRAGAAKTRAAGDAAPAKRGPDKRAGAAKAAGEAAPRKRPAGDAVIGKVAADAPAKPATAESGKPGTPGVARSVRGWSETPTAKPKRAPAARTGSNQIKGPERLAPSKVRLQKVLASAGVAARRKAEDLIARGRVTVNGRVANELGVKVDPERDQIRVDGKVVQVETRVYFVLNKPDGVVCSAEGAQDAEGRPTVLSLLPTVTQRIYPVGRLDYHTRGVLILTNDGDLAAALTHPRHKVTKTYHVKFQGRLGEAELAALGQGITLDDGVVTRPAEEISIIKETETNSWVQITLRQGLNRQVRRMGDAIGHPVLKLIRVAIGPVTADGLEDGEFRPLTPTEVYDLMAAASR